MAATPTRRRRFRAVRRLFIGAIAVAGFLGVAAFVFVYRQFMETLPPIQAAPAPAPIPESPVPETGDAQADLMHKLLATAGGK